MYLGFLFIYRLVFFFFGLERHSVAALEVFFRAAAFPRVLCTVDNGFRNFFFQIVLTLVPF